MSGKVFSIVVLLFNHLLIWILEVLVEYTKPHTRSIKEVNIGETLYKMQFINTAIAYLVTAWLTMNYFGEGGFIYNVNFYFWLNMILGNIFTLFSPHYIIKTIKKWKLLWQVNRESHRLKTTQREANKLMEGMEFNLAKKIAFLLKNLALSCFFCPILPMAVFYGLVTNGIYFFINVYIILRRSNSKIRYSPHVSDMTHELEFCLLLFPVRLFS